MSAGCVLVEDRGAVRVITLNRRLGFFSEALVIGYPDLVEEQFSGVLAS